MIKLYDFILTILTPFVRTIGKFYVSFRKKEVTGKHYYLIRDKIDVGLVFLTKTKGELSNLINPIEFKHSGIYLGDIYGDGVKYVAEAVGKGVVLTDLVTFLTTKDVVIGCKPKFIRNKEEFDLGVQQAAQRFVGIPYDYLFKKGGKAFYCFELSAVCLKSVYPELQLECREIVKDKKIYDHNTFLDPNFFEVTLDSREV